MEKTILHIDFDSFFASVEQQNNPTLRGVPMGVTATNGRTCIIASSREAKKLGIGTGSRSFDAYQICPSLILVPADFIKYWEVSKKFINICKDFSPFVEVFSIDELFMDITNSSHLFGGPYALIEKIKKRIASEIGEYITISVGMSFNKTVAKLASGLEKPNGLVEIKREDLDKYYKSAKLTDICGIGERIKKRLNMIGIYNLLDIRNTPKWILEDEFGKVETEFLINVSKGEDNGEILPYFRGVDKVKSVGRNYCLPQNQYDKKVVLQNLYELCEEIAIKLRRIKMKGRTIGIYLGGKRSGSGRKTYKSYFFTSDDIFRATLEILSENGFSFDKNYVRQIGIWVSSLEDEVNLTLPLFPSDEKKEELVRVVDTLNEKYGDHTIRNGFLLYADKLTTVPNGFMADKFERIKLASEYQY